MAKKKTSRKLLIVEDDEDFLSILKTKFIGDGFSVITAPDGENGISTAESEKPDLILSDFLLPRMNGLEMAQKIRETDKDTPIIFLTNINDADYTKKIEESHDFEYLIKSDVSISDIVEKVKTKLEIK